MKRKANSGRSLGVGLVAPGARAPAQEHPTAEAAGAAPPRAVGLETWRR